ncbi:MAG: hypothetical protein CMH32_05125 [Micavibrio sp.]|nr:hypothetical protein [Micavibrio sp.]HCK32580.1 hypothetical protein [Rhodospirillaceae bacterium]|tara:strand:+ start:264 stop:776 length:513 start_codon:yes stop_codon:yes gene_type:complete
MTNIRAHKKSAVLSVSALLLAIGANSAASAEDARLTKPYASEELQTCQDVFNGKSYSSGEQIVCPDKIENIVSFINESGIFGEVEHIGGGLLCQNQDVYIEGFEENGFELRMPFMVAEANTGPDLFFIISPEVPAEFANHQDVEIENEAQNYIANNSIYNGRICGHYLGS